MKREFMLLTPAFGLGLWNAWIFVLPLLVIMFSDMKVTSDRESGRAGDFKLTKNENKLTYVIFLPMIASFVYAIFLPLQLDTIWLYSGLLVYLFGIAFTIAAIQNFASSPKDKVITKGLYRYTRNPMYIGLVLIQTGVGIACASWLYLLLTVALMILLNANLSAEERYCLYRFGDDYQKYKSKTPRWIGMPKSEKRK
jgi:protein-S-isoprenylcysteine O-methyltransferase Ste14